ncbi:unnamed protein product [Litomosoides sigmodontis]|uniref:Tyrosine-protein kinase n=1 Tax=Litomosoides sigmodontis TaxID=42156 RepID=A0A3P6U385_LITSI|nr:unnamed protein product [Litomosoides sigmodontis]
MYKTLATGCSACAIIIGSDVLVIEKFAKHLPTVVLASSGIFVILSILSALISASILRRRDLLNGYMIFAFVHSQYRVIIAVTAALLAIFPQTYLLALSSQQQNKSQVRLIWMFVSLASIFAWTLQMLSIYFAMTYRSYLPRSREQRAVSESVLEKKLEGSAMQANMAVLRAKLVETVIGSSTGTGGMTNAQHEEEGKNSITDDLSKNVTYESYYHGFLPREDLSTLLEQVGDFLIRITQLKPGDPCELILSLRVSEKESPASIRHVLIHRIKGKDGKIEWLTTQENRYNSLKELIDAYVSSKKPVNPEIKTSQLIRPIARQPWEFLHENITLKNMLGEGQFGEVRAAEALIEGKKIPVAVKIAKRIKDKKHAQQAKEKIKEMMHEARLMRYFDHENVVKIHGVAVCREPLMIIIEMINGGCLTDVFESRRGNINENEKIENMSLGSARGLEYIHAQKIIHRDIAARNVLYTDNHVAKISDFGMSRHGNLYEMSKGNKKIPLKWTAPESMVTYQYTPKTDVFSFSILLWEIFSDGEEPYKGMTSMEVKRMISCGERLKKPEGCPDLIYQLMGKCWEQNPDNRYNMSEVVKQLEDVVEHRHSEESDIQQTCIDPHSAERISAKDDLDDSNDHLRTISISQSRTRRKKHHRRRKQKKSRSRRKLPESDDGRRKPKSRRQNMKWINNAL